MKQIGIFCLGLMLLSFGWSVEPVAFWKMDAEKNAGEKSVFTCEDMEGGEIFRQDEGTTPAEVGNGILGKSVHLQFEEPGPSTRLATSAGVLKGRSFGFSLFLNPVYLSEFDSFLQKELEAGKGGGNGFDDLAWQLHLLSNNGSGMTSLELVVRGQSDGFASVATEPIFKLGDEQTGHWIHVAGGYDASTGEVTLFVRDLALDRVAVMSRSQGAVNMMTNDTAPLSLGTANHGSKRVAFAANVLVDEVRLYEKPLTAEEVAALEALVLKSAP